MPPDPVATSSPSCQRARGFRFRLLSIPVLLALVAGCGTDEAEQQQAQRATPVTTEVLQPRAWSDTVQALGTVKARESITLTAKVSEIVQDVHFDSGDEVKAGAPLVSLSGQAQQAALNEALAAAEEASQLFERQNELVDQKLIARSQFDAQRAIRDAARARVAQIRAQLSDRVVRAPFAGVLGIRQVSPGALVTPGVAIATLDDIHRVYVDFPVPESQLALLAVGQALAGHSEAYPGRDFEGVVSTIDNRIDPATRAVTVRGDFDNQDRSLRPGMLLQVVLSRPEREALVLPEISIVQIGNASYVFRVKDDDTVERVDVNVGARREGLAEVLDGVEAGDRVVVDGTGKLRPGARVSEGGAAAPAATAPDGVAPTDEGGSAPASGD